MFTERRGVKRSERDLARRAYRGLLFQFYLPVCRKKKRVRNILGRIKSTGEKIFRERDKARSTRRLNVYGKRRS